MNEKITYTLEMESPEELRPKTDAIPGFRIERMETPCPELNKFFHTLVGYEYRWGGRASWGQQEWYAYANRGGLETWVAYVRGTPAGYFELERHTDGNVQIECIGLIPQFVGRGFGGVLLTHAVRRAWELASGKVFLRTSSYDHPHALPNYQSRGFKIAKKDHGPPNPPIKSFWELVESSCPD